MSNSQNRPLQLLAETAPSLDNSGQHLPTRVRKVGQYLDQILLVGQIANHLAQRKEIDVAESHTLIFIFWTSFFLKYLSLILLILIQTPSRFCFK